jgi:hypothetical protein
MISCRPQRHTAIVVLVGAIALGSCSTRPLPVLPSSQAAIAQAPIESAPVSIPYVAGTYFGTWKQTGGSGPRSGAITIEVRQYVSYLSGPILLKNPSLRAHLTFAGILEELGKHISFDMKLRWKSARGRGDASVVGSKIFGTMAFPARGSIPKTIISFTTKKR